MHNWRNQNSNYFFGFINWLNRNINKEIELANL